MATACCLRSNSFSYSSRSPELSNPFSLISIVRITSVPSLIKKSPVSLRCAVYFFNKECSNLQQLISFFHRQSFKSLVLQLQQSILFIKHVALPSTAINKFRFLLRNRHLQFTKTSDSSMLQSTSNNFRNQGLL